MGETIPVPYEKLDEWAKTMRDATNEINARNARISELESTIAHLREVAAEQHAWEEMAERCGLPLKPDAAEKCVVELREAVKALAAAAFVDVCKVRIGCEECDAIRAAIDANPIAAAAVREASNG